MSSGCVRVVGHFGELLQGRVGPDGPVALLSLPCPVLQLSARHLSGGALKIDDAGQSLITPERARRFLRRLGWTLSGTVILQSDMPAGGGAGASTATLVALARLAGATIAPMELAHACIEAEGASDPLMFANPGRMIWASRAGRILQDLPPLPRFDIIGGFFGADRRTEARDVGFPDISDLIPLWSAAASLGDGRRAAQIATFSARRTLSLRGPRDDPTDALARELGAAGFAIAHTGSARALLFPAGRIAAGAETRLRQAGFRGIVRFHVGECIWQ